MAITGIVYREQDWQHQLKSGKRPRLPLDLFLKRGEVVTNCVTATERADFILSAVKRAKEAMQAAQQRQKVAADRHRRPHQNISVGDMVYLSTAHIRLKFKGSPKLLPRWIGPFKVLAEINPVAYKLQMPENMRLHPVFHVALLKLATGVSLKSPPTPILLDGELEYEVEEIISHRFVGHNKLEYLVKWLGWGLEHNTWEPKANCANCPEKVSDYWARVQAQAGVRVTRGSKRVAPDSASVDEAPRRSKRARRAQNKTQRRH